MNVRKLAAILNMYCAATVTSMYSVLTADDICRTIATRTVVSSDSRSSVRNIVNEVSIPTVHGVQFFDAFVTSKCPVWARERCRISPFRFLAESCKRQLNQGSFVLLYFRLFTFSDLYRVYLYFPVLFCLSVSVK